MAGISFRPSKAYPSIPTVGETLESHSRALEAIREAVQIHERRTKDVLESFVRVQELIDLGLVSVDGNVVEDGGSDQESTTHVHDTLYIRLDGASPATTGRIDFGSLGLLVQGSLSTNTTTFAYNGVDFEIVMDSATSPQNFIIDGFVGGDFIVKGTGGGGRIQQQASSLKYVEMYHNTTQYAYIHSTDGLLFNSDTGIVGVRQGQNFRLFGGIGLDWMNFQHDGIDFLQVAVNTGNWSVTGFTGDFIVGNYPLNVNQTVSVAEDNHVLTYDNSSGKIGLEPLPAEATHTGEVTGDVALTLDVTSIANRSTVVADSLDEVPLRDNTDGTLRKTSLDSITDGGYF